MYLSFFFIRYYLYVLFRTWMGLIIGLKLQGSWGQLNSASRTTKILFTANTFFKREGMFLFFNNGIFVLLLKNNQWPLLDSILYINNRTKYARCCCNNKYSCDLKLSTNYRSVQIKKKIASKMSRDMAFQSRILT